MNAQRAILLMLMFALVSAAAAGCSSAAAPAPAPKTAPPREIVLSQQTWTESQILGSLFRILLEEKGNFKVKVTDLESFMLQWTAFRAGEIDILPAYTSTGYMTVLKDTGLRNPDEVYKYVKEEFQRQFNAVWLDRLGFYNNYDLAVLPEIARQYNLKTYSDLAKVTKKLVIVADVNFFERPDCYPLLNKVYGMEFKSAKTLAVELKYTTMANKQADIVNCYTTDAKIDELGLVVLEDDKHAFPPYDAAPLIRGEVLKTYPEIADLFASVSGRLTNQKMREMNRKVDVLKQEPDAVAREFLVKEGLLKPTT